MTDMETVGSGVKPAVQGARLIEVGRQLPIAVSRHLRQQASRLQIRNQFRTFHDHTLNFDRPREMIAASIGNLYQQKH
jgi:hypothetical protein